MTEDEVIDEWIKVGYTLEEATELYEASKINVNDIANISAEEASSYLVKAMEEYKNKE